MVISIQIILGRKVQDSGPSIQKLPAQAFRLDKSWDDRDHWDTLCGILQGGVLID
jgi:hypothetical protein